MKKSMIALLILLMSTSLLLTACGPKEPSEETGYPAVEQPAMEAEEGYPVGEQPPAVAPEVGYPAPGVISIATDATFPPFEMVDETTKELIGFDIELMEAVAAQAGLQYEFVNLPFDPMLAGLSECQYDMAIAAITITDERKEQFLFSDPYVDAGQIITVKTGNTSINSKEDLSGKILGAQLGTTGEIEARAIEGAEYKPYDTYDLAFLDLINGQIDAVIADNPTALGFIEKNPDRLMTVGEVFTSEFYGIAICKNRQDLLDIINPALAAVIESGFVEELAAKYLAGE
ncbi:MAG TPA: basic amino acid ABC transporter substrate-binding protein [Anaerolineaceae bacterium]|nr:basic amino acid ABC transporter substrate-binding protein [Anaerolineaceae bacterium]